MLFINVHDHLPFDRSIVSIHMDRLPELRDVPEDFDDTALLAFITSGFHQLKESQPAAPPIFDFPGALAWLFKLVLTRAEDKAEVLFRCGIILLNPMAAICPQVLSKVLACSSETVLRKVKGWPPANWDSDARSALLNMYDTRADQKNWVFRLPPKDSVFYRTQNWVFRPMEQVRQRIPEANAFPTTPVAPVMVLNPVRLRSRLVFRHVDASIAPATWVFNPHPIEELDFRTGHAL
jgi:hypothetical protein